MPSNGFLRGSSRRMGAPKYKKARMERAVTRSTSRFQVNDVGEDVPEAKKSQPKASKFSKKKCREVIKEAEDRNNSTGDPRLKPMRANSVGLGVKAAPEPADTYVGSSSEHRAPKYKKAAVERAATRSTTTLSTASVKAAPIEPADTYVGSSSEHRAPKYKKAAVERAATRSTAVQKKENTDHKGKPFSRRRIPKHKCICCE